MKTLIFAMPAFFRRSVAVMIQYRGEMLLWAFWGVVYPAVAMAMWSAAIAGKQGGGTSAASHRAISPRTSC